MGRTVQHLLHSEEAEWMWLEKGIRKRHHRTTLKAQESYPPEYHENLGDPAPLPPKQSSWTVELVTVRHLLVGLHIAQFLVSEFYLLSRFRIYKVSFQLNRLVPQHLQNQSRKNCYNYETWHQQFPLSFPYCSLQLFPSTPIQPPKPI